MYRRSVTATICEACLSTSAYVSNENGAASPGRWHTEQYSKINGAMCLLKVTGSAASAITKNGNVIHLIADSRSRPATRSAQLNCTGLAGLREAAAPVAQLFMSLLNCRHECLLH